MRVRLLMYVWRILVQENILFYKILKKVYKNKNKLIIETCNSECKKWAR